MKEQQNLVRLLDLDSDFIIDLRYATADNFTQNVVYTSSECYIDRHTGKQLIAAKNAAKEKGFSIKVWDAFRPVIAQRRLWDLFPNNDFVARPPDVNNMTEFKNSHMNGQCVEVWDAFRPVSAQRRFWDLFPNNDFVARPPDVNNMTEFKNSHMNGQCVDVTLTDLNGNEVPMPSEFDDFTEKARLDCKETTGEARKNAEFLRDIVDVTLTDLNGNEVPMPSEFDDFTEKARLDCKETTGEARKNAEFLRDIMETAGFTSYSGEWWHFYDRNTKPVKYAERIPD